MEVIQTHGAAVLATQPIQGLGERKCTLAQGHQGLYAVHSAGGAALGQRAARQLQTPDVDLNLQENS